MPRNAPANAPAKAPQVQPFTGYGYGSDDWKTFAHDFQHTGYQPVTGITKANAHKLTVRWSVSIGEQIYSSPLVYGGNVIIVSSTGDVFDFSPATGARIWKTTLPAPSTQQILSTPTIDGHTVFIGNRQADSNGNPAPSYLYALSLGNGALLWRTQLNGLTHDSPLVVNGVVYNGTSGGDYCPINGGVTALSEATGKILWTWKVNQLYPGDGGGSVWGPIAFDGTRLVFGTGNTCQSPITTANAIVALTQSGSVAWSYPATKGSAIDDDVGGGVMLQNGLATVMSKNGSLYRLTAANGQVNWATPLGANDQQGGFTTPTSDGSTIVVGAGFFCILPLCTGTVVSAHRPSTTFCYLDRSPHNIFKRVHPYNVVSGYNSRFKALDSSGSVLWTKTMTSTIDSYAAISPGIVYIGLDNVLNALDITTGNVLWSYTTPSRIESGPVVVPSGLYAVDYSGHLYRFTII